LKSRPEPIAGFSKSTSQHLNSYALAARAAGVGVLALVQPANAKIVYTNIHHVIGIGGSYKLDLNHDGMTDFTLRNRFNSGQSGAFAVLSAIPAAGNGVRGFKTVRGWAWASALQRGVRIGGGQYFSANAMATAFASEAGSGSGGSWINVQNRYLGLEFKIKRKVHYGWARLSVQVQGLSITATLTGYAYETIAGKSIRAGKMKGLDEITPAAQNGRFVRRLSQPATLGLLAMGAPGLSIWRREEFGECYAISNLCKEDL
jgi:hypothetical protein